MAVESNGAQHITGYHQRNGRPKTNGVKHGASLETLSADIARNVSVLARYFQSSTQDAPSFNRNTPAVVVPPTAPEGVQVARENLMDQALQIFHLASGPSEYLANAITGYHYMECLKWLTHFKIFELVPLEGSVFYSDLASQAKVSKERLKSIARMAITNGLFIEPTPGYIAHSATSAELISNPDINNQRNWICKFIAPAIASTVTAHEKWPTSTAPNNTPFNIAHNTDLRMYEYIGKQPELHKLFGHVMEAIAKSPKSDMKHLVNAFDWASLGQATVVDVGGSLGQSCIAVGKVFSQLNFIVQDTAHVIEEGKQQLPTVESDVAKRIEFQAYDFFNPQPVKGADAYLFRQIFHNWDYDLCVKILSNVVSAMGPKSHLLVMDFVLPGSGEVPAVQERVVRSRDIGMMQLFNSMERDMGSWNSIFESVNPKVKVAGVVQPFGSHLSVIDLVLA